MLLYAVAAGAKEAERQARYADYAHDVICFRAATIFLDYAMLLIFADAFRRRRLPRHHCRSICHGAIDADAWHAALCYALPPRAAVLSYYADGADTYAPALARCLRDADLRHAIRHVASR